MHGVGILADPTPDIQSTCIKFVDFWMHQRRPGLSERDIPELQSKAASFVEAAKLVLPERVGTRTPQGDLMGWNVVKIHSLFHCVEQVALFGYSENYSTQAPECAHKVSFVFT